MTASHSTCNCVVLASGSAGRVLGCPDCGAIHLALPNLSLRLKLEELRELSALVGKAQRLLDDAQARLSKDRAAGLPLH
ncbi:hypothetical protein HH212_00415 [Massilia forsythiae]|uniref:Uncharacterized protein n=1 Tax=Massilia forsythiae TaxID=2728020 RepID=A0A7Z2ZQR0_9BURK|nr:hypothetical protein [Massilia forsythiae]QJD98690.1 hypothetical protein HH212_00415 [Massilia forsythiae]